MPRGCVANGVNVFVRTSPFDERVPYYGEQASVQPISLSDEIRVMLSEFTPKAQQQADLFAPYSNQSDALMQVMDQVRPVAWAAWALPAKAPVRQSG